MDLKATHVVYPGTFDPITNGHIDIIYRGLKLFDRVTVAVSTGFQKNTLFNLKQRVALITEIFSNHPQIEVKPFEGLLADFITQVNADAVIRGLRAVSDFEYEFQMSAINHKLNPEMETIFLTPDEQYTCLSSTMIRQVAKIDPNRVSSFVPDNVLRALHQVLVR